MSTDADRRPPSSTALTMIGNMLFNLRQPQRSLDRDEVVQCLAEVEEALRRDLAAIRTPAPVSGGGAAQELADRLEAWVRGGFYRPGDHLPVSLQASIGGLICSHLPLVLAALRAVQTPNALPLDLPVSPDPAARDEVGS